MINIGNNKLKGHYTIKKYNALTNELVDIKEIDNTIADETLFGLDTTYNKCNVCLLNTEASPVLVDNVYYYGNIIGTKVFPDLPPLGSSESHGLYRPNHRRIRSTAPNYEATTMMTTRFNPGDITGVIKSIAIGHNDVFYFSSDPQCIKRLFSWAPILDENGRPTSITVSENEFLDITYILTLYPNIEEKSGTFILDGDTYSYTIKMVDVLNNTPSLGKPSYKILVCNNNIITNSLEEEPDVSFRIAYLGGTNPTNGSTSSSREIDSNYNTIITCYYNKDMPNFTIPQIGSLLISEQNISQLKWVINFDPPIPKDNTCTLEIKVSVPKFSNYTST